MKNKTIHLDSTRHNIFFTADTHFAHANVLGFNNRPYANVEDMNKGLVDNWNSVVHGDDFIFVVGDFCFGSQKTWLHLVNHLNGNKFLILGNHDRSIAGNWNKIDNMMNLLVEDPEVKGGQRITLCHYPMLSWYQSHRGSWQLYGHLHGQLSNKDLADDGYDITDKVTPNQLDVGVDVHNMSPISYAEVKAIITRQNLKKNGSK